MPVRPRVGTFVDLPTARPWERCFCALLSNAVLHLVPAASLEHSSGSAAGAATGAAAASAGGGDRSLNASTASISGGGPQQLDLRLVELGERLVPELAGAVVELATASGLRWELGKGNDHCLSFCFPAFPCGSTALTADTCCNRAEAAGWPRAGGGRPVGLAWDAVALPAGSRA
eukprot:SAG22_NODE_1543_length_4162_cov_1.982279_2_plen_174_part_00